MLKRMLAGTGLTVSALGLRCNTFGRWRDLDKTRAVAANEVGINFVDTADVCGAAAAPRHCWAGWARRVISGDYRQVPLEQVGRPT